jgi:hypothetical protein
MIDFIKPTFNEFTLIFPPAPYMHLAEQERRQTLDLMHERFAEGKVIRDATTRAERQTRKRLESLVGGGWRIEFEPHQHLGSQTSTRGDRRRAQLGRQ